MKRFLLSVLLLQFLSSSLSACPACNIHNYLSASVYEAKAIVKIVVLENTEKSTLLKVIRVYRGEYNTGDTLRERVWAAKGDTLIYLHGLQGMGPVYEQLPPSYEKEVIFLERRDSLARSPDEAKACILGVSAYSVRVGKQYFKDNFESLYTGFITLFDSMAVKAFSTAYLPMDEWTFPQLAEVLFYQDHPETGSFVDTLLQKYLRQGAGLKANYENISPTSSAYLLRSLLSKSGKTKYGSAIDSVYRIILQQGTELQVAEVLFALIDSKRYTMENALALAGDSPNDGIAIGLQFCAWQEWRWWQWNQVMPFTKMAIQYARNKALLRRLNEFKTDYEKQHK